MGFMERSCFSIAMVIMDCKGSMMEPFHISSVMRGSRDHDQVSAAMRRPIPSKHRCYDRTIYFPDLQRLGSASDKSVAYPS